MPRFLFWNLNKREIPGWVHKLARQEDADVLILAECVIPPAQLLIELNTESSDYQYAPGNCGHLVFFTRFDPRFLTPLFESHRISIRRLTLRARQSILLAAAHLPSKLNYSDQDQVFESIHLAAMIDDVEKREGHQRTILLGDLNMNPFENGMVAARGGLHAVMNRRVAARLTRTVQKEKYKFFYNPMWSHFGDRGDAGGTFYFDSGEPVCYFWNVFDQVLLRPELLDGFAHEHVRILTEVYGYSLIQDDGRPDKSMFSDHLPVLLELNF
jgi:exonuclease III